MGQLRSTLKTIRVADLDYTYREVDSMYKAVRERSGMEPMKIAGVLKVVGEIIIFVRGEFWDDKGVLRVPPAINVVKWIKIIVFMVRKVKEIIYVVR